MPSAPNKPDLAISFMPELLRILLVGDVVGEPGLQRLAEELPRLTQQYAADFVIVNGENVYEGKGIRHSDAETIFRAGANVITSGNHIWEKWQSKDVLANNRNVLRPLNYPRGNVGLGFVTNALPTGHSVTVINLQGRTFLPSIDCPFHAADWALEKLRHTTGAIIVDFHAEATAEKMALAAHLDGRVSAVIGTHTHVQTNDARILPSGTAFLTDVGMTGAYDSVIGMKKEVAIKRFMLQTPHKFEMATGDTRMAAVYLEIDPATMHAVKIEQFLTPPLVRERRTPEY